MSHHAAMKRSSKDEAAGKARQALTSVQTVEPKDAASEGGKDSRQRELLGKNVAGKERKGAGQPHPETVAGQHATVSFPSPARNTRKS